MSNSKQYQGQGFTVLRDAIASDPNFSTTAPASQQSFIRMEDGTEKAVIKSDLGGWPEGSSQHQMPNQPNAGQGQRTNQPNSNPNPDLRAKPNGPNPNPRPDPDNGIPHPSSNRPVA